MKVKLTGIHIPESNVEYRAAKADSSRLLEKVDVTDARNINSCTDVSDKLRGWETGQQGGQKHHRTHLDTKVLLAELPKQLR